MDLLKNPIKWNDIYTIDQKGMMGEKSPRDHKNKPHLVSLPSPLYDMESRLFSGPKSGPKTCRAFPTGEGPLLVGIKGEGKGTARK